MELTFCRNEYTTLTIRTSQLTGQINDMTQKFGKDKVLNPSMDVSFLLQQGTMSTMIKKTQGNMVRTRIAHNDNLFRLSSVYHARDVTSTCFRCNQTSKQGLLSNTTSTLEECAHCGFDVCKDCSTAPSNTLYSALFYAIKRNQCLCKECYHAMRCMD